MDNSIEILHRQLQSNRNNITELKNYNVNYANRVAENNVQIAILEAASVDLGVAINLLKEAAQ